MRSAGVLALGLAVAVALLAGQQLVATERAEVVATLWAEARYNFALWDHVRADWDSALSANLRLAAQPQSDVLFYRRLRRLVALLGDGQAAVVPPANLRSRIARPPLLLRSEEHTSELQSPYDLVCRLLLEKKKQSDGTCAVVGRATDWKGTIAGTVLKGQLYTIEQSGVLYATNLATGAWKPLGTPELAVTL